MSEAPPASLTRLWPSGLRVALVTVLAATASIAVDVALVWLATTFDPALQHYSHFRFSDYATLTTFGVICAGAAWYLATRNLTTPRQTFFRVAVVSMVVLWMPDVWLFIKHEPTRAVIYLMVMHLTIALITYNSLVLAAPVRRHAVIVVTEPPSRVGLDKVTTPGRVPRAWWVALTVAVAVEFLAGLIGMVYVPFNRPDGWLVHRGEAIYLVHALLGAPLGIAALAVAFHALRTPVHRVDRIAAVSGLCGVTIGAIGGALCVSHPLRLAGMAMMFVGVAVAFFGYLIPMIDDSQPLPSASSPVAV
jgi:hypothetical protein